MRPISKLSYEFVEFIPDEIANGVLYISGSYATAVHKCCCGCGREVVTPFSPTDWKLSFDGESVSLSPSIGNWSFPCRSHYWIQGNTVRWAGNMSREAIEAGRQRDRIQKQRQYGTTESVPDVPLSSDQLERKSKGMWARLWSWLSGGR